ncbi:hypothetical protein HY497_01450 [Candidatus Woesearchaeota archaeon]|nr:hypothetical protein [Candidatus Woesearchaeota archaeon]
MRSVIAEEQVRMIRLKDFALIAGAALVTAVFIHVTQAIVSPSAVYYLFLASFVISMNWTVYVLKKSGVAALFSFLLALFTLNVDDVGIFGWKKIVALFAAALIFEAVFLVLKLRLRSVPVDVVLGSGLLMAALPLLAAFLLSPGIVFSFPVVLLNLVLVSFVAGLLASFAAFVLWHFLSRTKLILKLEAYFGML